jgi:hypothetical protein
MAVRQRKTNLITEFGDFQTPPALACAATHVLRGLGLVPRSILEPTCGRGAFVVAAAASFPEAESIIGIDINPDHLRAAGSAAAQSDSRVELRQGNFFRTDWKRVVSKDRGPWLIVGNPPWVTSTELSALESDNLPVKSNFHGRLGIEAITGKSNFDISEWMLLRYLDWLEGSAGAIAVLCKTAVARKILLHAWKKKITLRSARIYKIDALEHFGAAVDACFFVLELHPKTHTLGCDIFDSLQAMVPSHTIGFLDGHIISDVRLFNRHRDLLGREDHYTWRSGIKHDCSKVMELKTTPQGYVNGIGEAVCVEDAFLFPMLKSSDIGNGRTHCRGAMVVTQQFIGEDTGHIRADAPATWNYLTRHAALLEKRGSVIYKNKPAFSIFGVGPYSFAPWKVAISGFYKKLHFTKIGPINGRPVVFDDTVYFLPCRSELEASFLESLLSSEPAHNFYHSMIHWEDKRPITVDILKRLSLQKLAAQLGRQHDYAGFARSKDQLLFAFPPTGSDASPLTVGGEGTALYESGAAGDVRA